MKKSEYYWIDRSVLLIELALFAIMTTVSLIDKSPIFLIVPLPIIFSAQWRPLIVRNGYFLIAPYNFPSLRRCRVSLRNVKKLTLWRTDEWFYTSKGSKAKFIIIEDLSGRRYRNIIWSPAEFKKAIEGMLAAGVIDKSWLGRIPKSLWPKEHSQ